MTASSLTKLLGVTSGKPSRAKLAWAIRYFAKRNKNAAEIASRMFKTTKARGYTRAKKGRGK
jgi:predicted transcriptional regulator